MGFLRSILMKCVAIQGTETQVSACVIQRRIHGFTLVELMIVIAILAIGLTLAVPSIRTISASNQVAVTNNSIMSGFNLARSEAITRGNQVAICPSTDGTACGDDADWATGWIVFDDADGLGAMVEAEVIRRSSRNPGVTLTDPTGQVVFKADGTTTLGASTTMTACYNDTDVTDKCRLISISRFGTVSSLETTS